MATKVEPTSLRRRIVRALRKQGYSVTQDGLTLRNGTDKNALRDAHALSRRQKVLIAEPSLRPVEDDLLSFVASGSDVVPHRISPRLVQVEPDSDDALLFRYLCLHWSIPVSSGYGRRLRFLVFDDSNGKVIGLFGLADPVYAMQCRDSWIGWTPQDRSERLYHVMDAYVLGAIPPYASLLCGKLVALLVTSNQVRSVFRRRYLGRRTLISGKVHRPDLALVTTMSAFGRSSVYNRLRIGPDRCWFASRGK